MKQSPIELLVGLVLPIVAVVLLDLVVVPLDSDIASVAAGVVWLAASVAFCQKVGQMLAQAWSCLARQ